MNAGTRLGPYEILAPLGAGGMGEVYRARDPRLHRDVAIKILPDTFVNDLERLARFEREAQVLAALNHPHIAHLYGLETRDDASSRALVMELVEGPTLAEKLASARTTSGTRLGLPLDETLEIARQVAEALDAAHQRGIIHRDLKPANIKVRPDGTVKVLDFGLANWPGPPRADDALNSPTITSPAMTLQGTIIGTAAYMAPEQAKGHSIDKRADIWAFGCVLFEMVTGRRPFDGESINDVLAAVIKDPPDWSALPLSTPDALRRLLQKCLAKQPKRRLHDIADARIEIEEAIAVPDATQTPAPKSVTRRETVAWGLAAILAVAAGVLGARLARSVPPAVTTAADVPPTRVSLVHRGTQITATPQISPDGRRVVYTARGPSGLFSLWVRELGVADAHLLAGTEELDDFTHQAFWSPDSRSIGFFASGGLQRISASGGGRQRIADIGFPRGGAWSSSGVILFAPEDNLGLVSVPENGGPATTVTTLPTEGVWEHSWPSFLPDGRRFLFTARPLNRPFETSDAGIYLGSLDSKETQRLLPDISSAIYSTLGYILFLREGILAAVPFDAGTGRVSGDAISLGEKVTTNSSSHRAAVSISGNNVMALRNATPFEDLGQLQWVDRRGAIRNVGRLQSYYFNAISVSPDGRLIAATIIDARTGTADIWLLDDAGNARQLTTSREWEGWPVWSADGKRIVYASTAGATGALVVQDVDGGEPAIVHQWREGVLLPRSWSADGRHLLVNRVALAGRAPDIFVWSFESKTLAPFLDSPAAEFLGSFSPDGRFVTYMSDEAGPVESWIAAFPTATDKRKIATQAGPISWRADGGEILVFGAAHDISAVSISMAGGRVVVGAPTVVAQGSAGGVASAPRDHSRVLRLVRPDPEQGVGEIQLLTGLLEKLR